MKRFFKFFVGIVTFGMLATSGIRSAQQAKAGDVTYTEIRASSIAEAASKQTGWFQVNYSGEFTGYNGASRINLPDELKAKVESYRH